MSDSSFDEVGRAHSQEAADKLARWNTIVSLPLVLSAVLPLIALPSGHHSTLAIVINIVAWLVFLFDLIVHQRLIRSYLKTWVGRFDLSVVILTAPWFIVFGPSQSKFVLLIRLARVARLVMAAKGGRRLIAQLGRVVIIAVAVVVVCSAVAYRAEHPTNAGFATFGDALWWGIVTLTTVGYGDIVPHTTAGRFAGVIIMITGIAVLGVLAGSLASFFRIQPDASTPSDSGDSGAVATPTDAVLTRLIELQTQVANLAEQLARLGSSADPPT